MNFNDVIFKHLTLQKDFRTGKLSKSDYEKKVGEMKVKAEDGIWWRIKKDGSGWEKQSGNEWVESTPSFITAKNTESENIYHLPKSPSTFFQFLKLLAFKSYQTIKKQWIISVILFSAILLFALYLNYGYLLGAWGLYNFFAAVFGNSSQFLVKLLLSIVLASFITWLMINIKSKGLQALLSQLSITPAVVVKAYMNNAYAALSVLLAAAGISMLLAVWIGNVFLALVLLISFYIAISDWEESNLFLAAALIYSDCNNLLKKDQTLNANFLIMLFAGLTAGMLLAVFFINALPAITYSIIGIMIAAAIFFIIVQKRQAVK